MSEAESKNEMSLICAKVSSSLLGLLTDYHTMVICYEQYPSPTSSSSSWREAISRIIPPLRFAAKTICPQPAREHQSPIFPCPGGSDGSMWWEVGLPPPTKEIKSLTRFSRIANFTEKKMHNKAKTYHYHKFHQHLVQRENSRTSHTEQLDSSVCGSEVLTTLQILLCQHI